MVVAPFFSSVAPVAKSATGKWVSRVGASGGGKTYKRSRPSNYYGALILIVVLGLLATVWARYDYQHPAPAVASTPPAVGTTWFAALSVQACGKTLPDLSPDPTNRGGFTIQEPNVIRVSPVSAADAGNNATLGQFAAEYPGLIASSTELAIPTRNGATNPSTTYHDGQACPTRTPYAGRTGHIVFAYWSTFGQKKPVITTNPSAIKFVQYMRVTMAFDPTGVVPRPPSQASVVAMVKAGQASTVTTTTTPSPTTTLKGATTTTTTPAASTTTTVPKG